MSLRPWQRIQKALIMYMVTPAIVLYSALAIVVCQQHACLQPSCLILELKDAGVMGNLLVLRIILEIPSCAHASAMTSHPGAEWEP